jgi:hypothetical protein
MHGLPQGFADQLAEVLEPRDRTAAAAIIEAATALDDAGLRVFLEMFAERVRRSGVPIRRDELEAFLRASLRGGRADAP